jgi:hypothetical protein
MGKTLSDDRIHTGFSKIKKIFGEKAFSISSAKKALNLSDRSTSLILSELVEKGLIVRTGRGNYAFIEKPTPRISLNSLSDDSKRLYHILKNEGIQFSISCLDILVGYTHLILRRYPHFCWVQSGSEDWAMEAIESSDFVPLRNPSPTQLNVALDLTPADRLVIVRKTTNFYAVDDGLATTERALVDLYYEVTRERYPLDEAEVMRIYYNVLTSLSLEYPKMLRYAGMRRFRNEITWIFWKFKDRIDIPKTYIKKPKSRNKFTRRLPALDEIVTQ